MNQIITCEITFVPMQRPISQPEQPAPRPDALILLATIGIVALAFLFGCTVTPPRTEPDNDVRSGFGPGSARDIVPTRLHDASEEFAP